MAFQSTGTDDDFLPNIRRACEECHNRKIRCNIPKDSGSCQYCQSNNRLCFFLPRNRSGRPRASQNEQKGEKSVANATATSQAVCAALAARQIADDDTNDDADSTQLPRSTSTLSNFPPTATSAPANLVCDITQHHASSQPLTYDFNTMDNMGMSQPCLSQWGGIDASKRFPYTSFEQPPPPAPSTAEMPNPFEISPSASSRSLDTMMGSDLSMPWNTGFSFSSTPATMSNSPPDSDGLDHGNDHYANLLSCTKQVRLCYATLQSQIRGTMRGQRCPQPQLEAALKIVESSCRASCDILRHSSSSSASMPSPNWSLIAQAITLVFNIIDICELLVEGTVGPQADGGAVATTRQTTLDDLYVIKRLELSVVQTRMSLNQVQDLNQSFASLVQGTKSRIMALQALFESVKCSH